MNVEIPYTTPFFNKDCPHSNMTAISESLMFLGSSVRKLPNGTMELEDSKNGLGNILETLGVSALFAAENVTIELKEAYNSRERVHAI